jgi:hypothetical protein
MRRTLNMKFVDIAKELGRSIGGCTSRYRDLYPHEKIVRIKKSGVLPKARRAPSIVPDPPRRRRPPLHEQLGIRTMTVCVPCDDRNGRRYMDVTLPAV